MSEKNHSATVLVVDDDPGVRTMLCEFLGARGFRCLVADSVDNAVNIVENEAVDVILVDVNLEGKSGFDLISYVNLHYSDVPCIVVTGNDDWEVAKVAIDVGAYGYVVKPFSLTEILVYVENALRRRRLEILKKQYHHDIARAVSKKTEDLQSIIFRMHSILHGTVMAVSGLVEVRDPYTAGHQRRVASLASVIAQEMGLSKVRVENIYTASLIHDIGKIAVPAEILNKPGKLDSVEFELIKRHPHIGYNILKDIDFGFPAHEIVYQHHERINGSGYPRALKGSAILIEARIIAVADVAEAIASHRPYRPSLGIDFALKEIEDNQGELYDPEVVECCVRLFKEKGFRFEKLY